MSLVPNPTYFPRCRMVYDYVVEPREERILPLLHSPEFDYGKYVILEEKPLAPVDSLPPDTGWNCRIANYSLNKIDIDVSTGKNGLLVLSEIYYPAWTAVVDGTPTPLYRADYALRAIPVERGRHTVSCRFSPAVFKKGLMISLVSFALAFALGTWGWVRTRKDTTS